jgi:hypothetical protein
MVRLLLLFLCMSQVACAVRYEFAEPDELRRYYVLKLTNIEYADFVKDNFAYTEFLSNLKTKIKHINGLQRALNRESFLLQLDFSFLPNLVKSRGGSSDQVKERARGKRVSLLQRMIEDTLSCVARNTSCCVVEVILLDTCLGEISFYPGLKGKKWHGTFISFLMK